jgi:hypothetical protein
MFRPFRGIRSNTALHTAAPAFLANYNEKRNHFHMIAAILGEGLGWPQPDPMSGTVREKEKGCLHYLRQCPIFSEYQI